MKCNQNLNIRGKYAGAGLIVSVVPSYYYAEPVLFCPTATSVTPHTCYPAAWPSPGLCWHPLNNYVILDPSRERKSMAHPRLLTSRRCWLHLILVVYESWQLCMYKISQSESLRAMPNMIMSTMNFSFVKPAPTAGKKCQPQAWDTLVNSRRMQTSL